MRTCVQANFGLFHSSPKRSVRSLCSMMALWCLALLLLASGIWLTVDVYGGWAFLDVPWLVGMVALFAFEFIEGNTITRLYFLRLRRLTTIALANGSSTPELVKARSEHVPTFTHFLDLPILFVIVALGVIRQNTWRPLLGWNGHCRHSCGDTYTRDAEIVSVRYRARGSGVM